MSPDDLFDLPFEDAPAGVPPPPPARRLLTVTELTVRLRDAIEGQFHDIWIEGELSNCRVWNTGHLFFTLKDETCQIRGFMFRSVLRYLKFKPADGLRVVARGKVSVYEPKGEYQLVCEHLEPQGIGALQLAFEQLKKRLLAEGLFDSARKRPLPLLPRKLGVVTSFDGAALRDILKVLGQRHARAHVVIRPARVQGEGAAAEIARAIRAVTAVAGVDVVIVGRGGGSIEDLWAFNDESVARAIASAAVPVISAVGHETDVTIADFVADLRAPTPSAAAALILASRDDLLGRVERLDGRLRGAARGRVQGLARRLHVLGTRPALVGVPGRVAMRGRDLAEITHALARAIRGWVAVHSRHARDLRGRLDAGNLGRQLARIRSRLTIAETRLAGAIGSRRQRAAADLSVSAGRLAALSPLAVLGRGYAVCWSGDRTRIIRDASAVAAGEPVTVTLDRGELDCLVHASRPTTE